ncbi:MAG: PEGA domain-containing protein [Deltaproteobacteria bacterium]|nr:PEGA domain-containing protein [Deltaproteobacteria bacterium]
MRGVARCCVLSAVLLGWATTARAQEPAGGAGMSEAAPTAEDRLAGGEEATDPETIAEARALFERGTALMQNENWAVARVELARSFALYPTRSALFNLAMCNKALHEYVAALRRFEEWQEWYRDQATEEERQRVAAAMDQLRQFLATLLVTTEPPGATVRVDDEEAGTTPLASPVVVGAGTHIVEASLDGHATARTEVLVAPLDEIEVPLRLEPEPVAGVAGAATAAAGAGPGSGGDPSPSSDVSPVWFWTAAGTAAAMGIGGAVAGGLVLDKQADLGPLEDQCRAGDRDACDRGLALLSEHDDAQLAANVLLFGAGAFAVTALVLAFFTDFDFGDDEAPPLEMTAGPAGLDASGSPTGFVVGVGGRF